MSRAEKVSDGDPPTLGVQEEYLLLDPDTGYPCPVAEEVSRTAELLPALGAGEVQNELLQVQVEVATPVCHELDEIGGHLLRLRHEVGIAAEEHQARLVACGAVPWSDGAAPVSPDMRHRDLELRAPALVDEQFLNGMQVHVGVPDRRAAVEVINRIRPDLPLLVALAGNSPFWRGRDSGFDSWRVVHLERWPTGGPPPHFIDETDYDVRVEELFASGAARDRRQLYWHVRVGAGEWGPTVEIRCADVQLRVDDAVLFAGLVRAMVSTAIGEPAGDPPPTAYQPEAVRAASWVAARHGLGGDLYDLRLRRRRRAGDLLCDLLERVDGALRATGDEDQVRKLVDRLLRDGNGAQRQRQAVRTHGIGRLTEFLSGETVSTGLG